MKKNTMALIATTILFTACNPGEKQETNKHAPAEHHTGANVNLMMKAMDESMLAMHKAKQTGNADHDFAAMMVPHHEGAVLMAKNLMGSSRSEQLINFAKQVIAAQNMEIETLRTFLETADQTASPQAESFKKAMNRSMQPMMEGMNAIKLTGDGDKDFVALMIPHHQSAVEMAKTYLPYSNNAEIKRIAKEIIKSQEKEIGWLKTR